MTKYILSKEEIPYVIFFYESGSSININVLQVLESLEKVYEKRINFYTVDINTRPTIVDFFGVAFSPTFIFMKDNKEINRIIGDTDKSKFVKILNLML